MKQSALKSIISDLNMAGIYDIPAGSFMDFKKIESSPIVKQAFDLEEKAIKATLEINSDPNLPNSEDMANQINALFSTFDENKKREQEENEEEQEFIEIKTIEAKPAVREKPVRKKEAKQALTQVININKEDQKAKAIELPNPEKFISIKQAENAKLIAIINIANENKFENSEEYTLLNNILKTLETSVKDTSLIFIDNSYKKITLDNTTYFQKLASYLQKSVESLPEQLIFCFGEDCLKLATSQETTIRTAIQQEIGAFNGKNLLANYSLSAMINNPKYKKITWANILLIKENNEVI